jgi:hypothetical protein
MTTDIRFRVTPKLRKRAERVVKLRSQGRAKPETLSDFGREYFYKNLLAAERELGIVAKEAA